MNFWIICTITRTGVTSYVTTVRSEKPYLFGQSNLDNYGSLKSYKQNEKKYARLLPLAWKDGEGHETYHEV